MLLKLGRNNESQAAAPRPLVRTMLETIPAAGDGGAGVGLDISPGFLDEIFNRRAAPNSQARSLLEGREQVDIRQLSEELNEFASMIGAIQGEK